MNNKNQNVFKKHQQIIAKKVVKENPIFTALLGGMNKKEAKQILKGGNKNE